VQDVGDGLEGSIGGNKGCEVGWESLGGLARGLVSTECRGQVQIDQRGGDVGGESQEAVNDVDDAAGEIDVLLDAVRILLSPPANQV